MSDPEITSAEDRNDPELEKIITAIWDDFFQVASKHTKQGVAPSVVASIAANLSVDIMASAYSLKGAQKSIPKLVDTRLAVHEGLERQQNGARLI